MDATYKLTDDKMAVYLLSTIDGNGESQMIGILLAHNETFNLLQQMMDAFTSHFDESTLGQTRVIITDKDFTERAVLSKCFHKAQLQLCLFHTLQSFVREVTSAKMSFQPEQRTTIMEIK